MDRPGPGLAQQGAAVAVGEPGVPDGRAVLLDRAGGQRRVVELAPAPHVAEVVVDFVVDLVLHPGRGRLREPGVLEGVVAELKDVVVLVGERHLEVIDRLRAGELEGAVVVVDDQVAVEPARDPALLALAAVRRRVAEQGTADLGEVDVGPAVAAATAFAVALRLTPAELPVLDRVHVFGDLADCLDEVGDAVVIGVSEARGVEALGHPVDAEVIAAGG